MSGAYRVRVNLDALFSDERARLMVAVRAARSVRSLERRVRTALGLRDHPRLLLLVDDHLLPPAERLAVLRPDDTVRVLPAPTHYTLDGDRRADAPREDPHLLNGEPADDEALRESKARALLQLDRLCGERAATTPPTERSDEERAPRQRRRRVRRRRAAPYPPGEGEGEGHGEGEGPRPPRLVTALERDASP